ncbi:hypothetical protein CPLU01_10347 [Colletotrichum plurivorum]|uniref:Uncharacterized protein n=1 Tax=Colletotrichum plurivorum TaxID=2175906 RepID=A0A8H6NA66_9PEZI|nr:hypothetical protein CPLU01_10347 [Colletotrichum plurivorum]
MIVFVEFFVWLAKKLWRHLTEFMTDRQLGSMAILAPIFVVPCSYSLRMILTVAFLELTSLQNAACGSLLLVIILWDDSILDITATAFPKLRGPLMSAAMPVFVHVSTVLIGNTVDFWWHPTQLMPSDFCADAFDTVSFITALAGSWYFPDSDGAQTPAACPAKKESYSLLQDCRDYAVLLFCISLCLNIGQQTRTVLERRLHGPVQARIQALLQARTPLPRGLPKLISSFRVFHTTVLMCEGALAIILYRIVAHACNDVHCGILCQNDNVTCVHNPGPTWKRGAQARSPDPHRTRKCDPTWSGLQSHCSDVHTYDLVPDPADAIRIPLAAA